MHRFYVPPNECQEDCIALSAREAHHALDVLRLRPGGRVVVLDGAGAELMCEVRETNRRAVVLQVVQRNSAPPLPCEVTLLQAMTKGKTMELIIQKAAELGARRVVPILSRRTVAHLDDERVPPRVEKWEAIAIDAIKQCGSAWLPRVEAPLTPADFLAKNEHFDLSLIASLQSDARHPREYFESFLAEKNRRPGQVGVWVGPEGDFTPAEMNDIRVAGVLPITLGQLVLRSDTAAIYCLSIINYELQTPLRAGG